MSTKDSMSNRIEIKVLGGVSVIAIICLTICFLASSGFNTYVKYSNNKKEIEVQINSNSNSNSSENE